MFDEPEAGIDLWSFSSLINVFENMREKTQGDIIIISHQERILNVADNIVVLANGKIRKCGTRDEILPEILGSGATCETLKNKLSPAGDCTGKSAARKKA